MPSKKINGKNIEQTELSYKTSRNMSTTTLNCLKLSTNSKYMCPKA